MKLVEILAKELVEWPGDAKWMTQEQNDSSVTVWHRAKPKYQSGEWTLGRPMDDREDYSYLLNGLDTAHDYKTSVVGLAQWQAERDRQKGGEWKRHRGGKCPVHGDQHVEVKFRDGAIEQSHASDFFGWKHREIEDADAHIMQYRIISQPQAEEVEVNKLEGRDVRLEYLMTGNKLPYEVHCGEVIHGPISIGDEVVAPAHPKWDQVESPFKWRDTVNELDAYIEEFTRERDELIERLASEGFALIPPVVSFISEFAGVQVVLPCEEWIDGDIVRCVDIDLSCAVLTLGKEYTVVTRHGETGVIDDEDDHMCSCIDVGELEFVRRP